MGGRNSVRSFDAQGLCSMVGRAWFISRWENLRLRSPIVASDGGSGSMELVRRFLLDGLCQGRSALLGAGWM